MPFAKTKGALALAAGAVLLAAVALVPAHAATFGPRGSAVARNNGANTNNNNPLAPPSIECIAQTETTITLELCATGENGAPNGFKILFQDLPAWIQAGGWPCQGSDPVDAGLCSAKIVSALEDGDCTTLMLGTDTPGAIFKPASCDEPLECSTEYAIKAFALGNANFNASAFTTTISCSTEACSGCQPQTCIEQGIECGQATDLCGNQINCGSCDDGDSCVNNQCQADCVPLTCQDVGAECGDVEGGDNCGNELNCGTCEDGFCTDDNVCVECLTNDDCDEDERCNDGTCEEVVAGSQCFDADGLCGACTQDCGNDTNFVCGLYTTLVQPQCQIRRAGNGGQGCGNTDFKCCVIFRPADTFVVDPNTGLCPLLPTVFEPEVIVTDARTAAAARKP